MPTATTVPKEGHGGAAAAMRVLTPAERTFLCETLERLDHGDHLESRYATLTPAARSLVRRLLRLQRVGDRLTSSHNQTTIRMALDLYAQARALVFSAPAHVSAASVALAAAWTSPHRVTTGGDVRAVLAEARAEVNRFPYRVDDPPGEQYMLRVEDAGKYRTRSEALQSEETTDAGT